MACLGSWKSPTVRERFCVQLKWTLRNVPKNEEASIVQDHEVQFEMDGHVSVPRNVRGIAITRYVQGKHMAQGATSLDLIFNETGSLVLMDNIGSVRIVLALLD